MFNGIKRYFPKETFIPLSSRILTIIHLCIAFTLLLSYCGSPFMGDIYSTKSKKVLLESVIGSESPDISQKFTMLSVSDQCALSKSLEQVKDLSKKSFTTKLLRSGDILLTAIPPFIQGWILFSVIISLMILLKIPGSSQSSLALPLMTYAAFLFSTPTTLPPDTALYPSENLLIQNYLDEPLDQSILAQYSQLQQAWNRYLIDHWAPQGGHSEYISQLDEEELLTEGLFQFNLARVKAHINAGSFETLSDHDPYISNVTLILLLLWSTLFAGFMFCKNVTG